MFLTSKIYRYWGTGPWENTLKNTGLLLTLLFMQFTDDFNIYTQKKIADELANKQKKSVGFLVVRPLLQFHQLNHLFFSWIASFISSAQLGSWPYLSNSTPPVCDSGCLLQICCLKPKMLTLKRLYNRFHWLCSPPFDG